MTEYSFSLTRTSPQIVIFPQIHSDAKEMCSVVRALLMSRIIVLNNWKAQCFSKLPGNIKDTNFSSPFHGLLFGDQIRRYVLSEAPPCRLMGRRGLLAKVGLRFIA